MNFSFEDALLEDEELEQYQDFIYDIADISVLKGRKETKTKDQGIINEDINSHKKISASPKNAFNWSTKEKNEFIAKMKLNKQKVSIKMVYGKPIEPDKVINDRHELTGNRVKNLYGPETIVVPRYGPESTFARSIPNIKGLYGP